MRTMETTETWCWPMNLHHGFSPSAQLDAKREPEARPAPGQRGS